jgi:hypothetical protein
MDTTVAAYSRPSLGPHTVRPINARLGSVLGMTTTLLSVEESEDWFNVRYHVTPWLPTPGPPHSPALQGRYEATDDLGNHYRGFGNSGEGARPDEWTGELAFYPALGTKATTLTLALKAPDESDLMNVTVAIDNT